MISVPRVVPGKERQFAPHRDLAYRIILALDQISDPELRDWVSKPSVHFWIGPRPCGLSRQRKLMYRAELESWTNEKGNFVLIGDSCHPMLPYLAQGANSSIENGGVLGRLLGSVESKLQLPQAIKLYEQLQKALAQIPETLGDY